MTTQKRDVISVPDHNHELEVTTGVLASLFVLKAFLRKVSKKLQIDK